MAYPGDPSLAAEAQERVINAFQQVVRKLQDGQREQAEIGLEFVLRLDPLFTPAIGLNEQFKAGGEIDVDQVLASMTQQSSAEVDLMLVEAVEHFNDRDYVEASSKVEQVLRELPGHREARDLKVQIDEALKVRGQVGQYLSQAQEALDKGDPEEASNFVMMAQALDPHHPGIAAALTDIQAGSSSGLWVDPNAAEAEAEVEEEEAESSGAFADPFGDEMPADFDPGATMALGVGESLPSLSPPTLGVSEPAAFDAPEPVAFEAPAPPAPEPPAFETPAFDAAPEPAAFGAPEAPAFDAPAFDAPAFDAPAFDAPATETPAFEAPPDEPEAPAAPAMGTQPLTPPAPESGDDPFGDGTADLFQLDSDSGAFGESATPDAGGGGGGGIQGLFAGAAAEAAAEDLDEETKIEQLADEARGLLAAGDHRGALELADKALRMDNNSPVALKVREEVVEAAPPEVFQATEDDLFSPRETEMVVEETLAPIGPPPLPAVPIEEAKQKKPPVLVLAVAGILILALGGFLGTRFLGSRAAEARQHLIEEALLRADEFHSHGQTQAAIDLLRGLEDIDALEQGRIDQRIKGFQDAITPPTPTPIPVQANKAEEAMVSGNWFYAYLLAKDGLKQYPNDQGLLAIVDEIRGLRPTIADYEEGTRRNQVVRLLRASQELERSEPAVRAFSAMVDTFLFNAALSDLQRLELAGATRSFEMLAARRSDDDEVQRILETLEAYRGGRDTDLALKVFSSSLSERVLPDLLALSEPGAVSPPAAVEPEVISGEPAAVSLDEESGAAS